MATRNERKRLAKARHAELLVAVSDAFKAVNIPVIVIKPRSDVFDIPNLLQGRREPRERIGMVQCGKFMAKPMPEYKRMLTLCKDTGNMIEKAKIPSGLSKRTIRHKKRAI